MKVIFTGIAVFLSFMFYIYFFMWRLFCLFVCFFFGGGMWDLVPCQGLNPDPLRWERGVLATLDHKGGPRDGFQHVFALSGLEWTAEL